MKNVLAAARRRNTERCMNGQATCDPVTLTAGEAAAAAQARRKRNYDQCLNGSSACDPLLLTAPESAAVAAARRQRTGTRK
jgi:hypothetical protein